MKWMRRKDEDEERTKWREKESEGKKNIAGKKGKVGKEDNTKKIISRKMWGHEKWSERRKDENKERMKWCEKGSEGQEHLNTGTLYSFYALVYVCISIAFCTIISYFSLISM